MPSILSKLFPDKGSVSYNCYETLHPWTPNCTEASLGVASSFFLQSFKIHTGLYLFNQLVVRRQYTLAAFQKTLECCLQSSSFMGLTPLATIATFCTIRSLSEKFYFYRQLFIPTLFGSLLGVSCDFPARRETVTIFALQICTEIIFRTLVEEGSVTPIKNGSVYLLGVSSMLAMHLYTKYPDAERGIVGMILDFVTDAKKTETDQKVASKYQVASKDTNNNTPKENENLAPKDNCDYKICEHAQGNCIKNVLTGAAVTFSASTVIQVLISTFSNPSFESIKRNLTSERVIRTSAFASSYVAIYRATSCLLSRFYFQNSAKTQNLAKNQDFSIIQNFPKNPKICEKSLRDRIKIVSAGLASISMILNPSPSITLYFFWKTIHNFISSEFLLGDRSKIDKCNFMLQVFLVAHIMYSGLFNAGRMRPSYMKFMGQMSGGRIYELNRRPLASFGVREFTQDKVPQLDATYCTEEFVKDYLTKGNN